VTQENPERQASAMTPNREVPGTMNVFREIHPELISRPALQTEFRSRFRGSLRSGNNRRGWK
jgi:hypothetical protein